jgi:hypothetical protein
MCDLRKCNSLYAPVLRYRSRRFEGTRVVRLVSLHGSRAKIAIHELFERRMRNGTE